MIFKYVLGSLLVGVILANRSFSIPAAALPSFAFIFLVYGVLILWELRRLLPALNQTNEQGDIAISRIDAARPAALRASDPVFHRIKTA